MGLDDAVFCLETGGEENHLKFLGVEGRMILKVILKNGDPRMCT